jgi:hypothetical protein
MARLLSPIASVIRGSVAGLTFAANQYHQIIVRQKTAPVNPATTNQTLIRNSFAAGATAWLDMTQTQRDGWDAWAQTVNFSGPMGDYNVPGRQNFMAIWSFIQYLTARGLYAFSPAVTVPAKSGRPTVSSISLVDAVAPDVGFSISITNDLDEDLVCYAERSGAFTESRNNYKGPFLPETGQAVSCPASTSARIDFYDLPEDNVYFVKLRFIVEDPPHRLSIDHILRAVSKAGV